MKYFPALSAFILSFSIQAQPPHEMSQEQMDMMMQHMAAMQACLQKIDQAPLNKLESESQVVEDEIESLCRQGQRVEAQRKAIEFGSYIANSPAMIAMKECNKHMEPVMDLMPEMAKMPEIPYSDPEADYSDRHVCDN